MDKDWFSFIEDATSNLHFYQITTYLISELYLLCEFLYVHCKMERITKKKVCRFNGGKYVGQRVSTRINSKAGMKWVNK